jgi:TonB family protein
VEADDGALAGSSLTLAVPEGGVEGGHPDLVGGTLAAGKEAYQGALPAGNLVARAGDGDRLTALASVAIAGPGEGDGQGLAMAGEAAEPTRGRGLVSRGGADATTRTGALTPRSSGDGPATAIQKSLAAPAPAREEEVAVAASSPDEEKSVSMSLSGPILDRKILCSEAPDYPEEARCRAWQGTVSVYFTVRADGTVAKAIIEQASAHRVLDDAARRCIREWRFSPQPGAAEQWGILTIIFRLR